MSMKSHPAFLLPGDEIRIISPASAPEKDYIDKTAQALQKLGYKVTLGKNALTVYHQFAGEDNLRLEDAQSAMDEKQVKAIFCARGGYGSIRIIDKLDFSHFRENPKWIVGFSDITVFHSLLNGQYRIPTIHSPMPVNYESPAFNENLDQLNDLLQGKLSAVQFGSHSLNRMGVTEGRLIGGNLSILHNLQSTPYEVDAKGKILFIEDVGEQLYHLDRMLNNFRLSGKLDSLSGLIVGSMTDMKDKKRPFGKSAYEIIAEAVKSYNYPLAFGFEAGHTENNVPFILGADIEFRVSKSGSEIRYS